MTIMFAATSMLTVVSRQEPLRSRHSAFQTADSASLCNQWSKNSRVVSMTRQSDVSCELSVDLINRAIKANLRSASVRCGLAMRIDSSLWSCKHGS